MPERPTGGSRTQAASGRSSGLPPGEPAPAPGAFEDTLLGGRVRLLQRPGGHRAGTDAVLLAATAAVRSGESIIDLGAGTGAVGLMVAVRVPDLQLTFVERDPELAGLCRRNLDLNGLSGRVVEADALDRAACARAGLKPASADWVLTNPPYLRSGRSRASPDAARAEAHMMAEGGLSPWLQACARLLKPKGKLALIHRADHLSECLAALSQSFGNVCLRAVHPQAEKPAIRLLLRAVKGSRAPLRIEPPLVLHEPTGRFTPFAQALHLGNEILV